MIHNHDFHDIRIAFQPLAEFLDAPADACRGQRLIEHVVNQGGFARTAHPGHHRERSQRNHQIQILQVVQARAIETDEPAPRFVAYVGHGNPQLPAEIAARQRFVFFEHGRVRAGKQQLTAEFARTGAQIDDAIRSLDGVWIVFHNQYRVPQIAKRFENIDEPLRVAWMQADRRFIEHVECAHQM